MQSPHWHNDCFWLFVCFPGLVTELKDVVVTQVALGKAHAVVLTNKGHVYTHGINNKGQCGRDFLAGSTRESECWQGLMEVVRCTMYGATCELKHPNLTGNLNLLLYFTSSFLSEYTSNYGRGRGGAWRGILNVYTWWVVLSGSLQGHLVLLDFWKVIISRLQQCLW